MANGQNTSGPTRRFGSRVLAAIGTFNQWPLSHRFGAAAGVVMIGAGATHFPAVAVASVLGGVLGGVLAREGLARGQLIRQSVDQLRQFIAQAPTAMALFDRDMRYLATSARWREDHDLDSDPLGKSHDDVHPDIPDQWKDIHRRALAGETLRAEQDAFKRRDGSTQWLRWEVRPWFRRGDGIGGVIIFSEDITERVAAREAMRALVDNLPDSAIYRYTRDPDGALRFLFLSAGIEKLTGVTVEQALADAGALYRRILPEYKLKLIEAHQSSLLSGSDVMVEAPMRRPDGEVRWMRLRSRPVRQIDDRIVWHGLQTDITDKRETLEALRDSERQFKAVFDTSMEGVVTIDSTGVMLAANPAAADMFGYRNDELPGRNISMLTPEPHTARHDSYLAHYLQTDEKSVIGDRRRLLGLRKNRQTFPMELIVTEAAIGHEVLFIGFIRDLTPIENERRRVNDLHDELARVSRMNDMGEVVAALAHEIGQPLAAIRNYSFAARGMMPSDASSPIRDLIEKIEKMAIRGGDIISRLRQFIEKRDKECAPQSLRRLIAEAMSVAAMGAGALAAPITLDLLDTESEVCVDRVQIEQVLVNFLRNAADATASEPKPQIVVATAVETPGLVRVSVSDNGPGVDPAIADRLFNPFVTTKKFGMGVGLSLCKSIVEDHGGKIGYCANDPRGAVFFFTLPTLERPDGPGPNIDRP